ncbi:queuosine biosynthesis protein QueC [Candidatus Omnitrophus magneticus]|uniref:7-cyano-7-deazaguanine synthase n=1 Tax=Candidatus Omnitrophus magneticus TaxID=1609969 RepID=A0A0F0CVZ4_9BACT|nr:queuosine biosynthesis protein QueC [Candidatus Omnitrophus magneticus]
MHKAVVLLSGGMDSAVTLYIAKQKYQCHVLIFDYGQQARKEIISAKNLAKQSSSDFYVIKITLPWKGSALLDKNIKIPENGDYLGKGIPSTYVPARNIIFLSFGVSFAEAIGANAIFIGAHELDFSNYPDCRGEFFDSFQKVINKGTKSGVNKSPVKIITPILNKTKKEIVKTDIKHSFYIFFILIIFIPTFLLILILNIFF